MISNDGVTTRNFTIDRLSGIFGGVSLDADLSRAEYPSSGQGPGNR